jgi:small subunit ribosomal protein S15
MIFFLSNNSPDGPLGPLPGTDGLGSPQRNMLDKNAKEKIIEKFKTHATDTGSPQVQVAILSAEIGDLTRHLQSHKKDFSSRRGLLKKVSERRRLLKYLSHEDPSGHKKLTEALEKTKF